MQLTDEQSTAVELATQGVSLKIEAGAGTGKTATLQAIGEALAPRRGLLLAFNRAMREDAERRMPTNVTAKTFHALAFAAVGRHFQHRLEARLTPPLVQQRFSIRPLQMGNRLISAEKIAVAVLGTVYRFCQTMDTDPGAQHVPQQALLEVTPPPHRSRLQDPQFATHLADILFSALSAPVAALWSELIDVQSDFPIFHDVYLKIWAMSQPLLPYDFLLVDEAQDSNPLMLSVVSRQPALTIYVGDPYQQMYSWRGAENAMRLAPADQSTRLTQSFRFGQAVADVANASLQHFLGIDFGLRGLPEKDSKVAPIERPDWILCRSNAAAIAEILALRLQDQRVAFLGNERDIRNFLQGAQQLLSGQPVTLPDFAGFSAWEEVREFAESPMGSSWRPLVRLVDQHSPGHLLRAIDTLEKDETTADVLVSTVHQAKGRQATKVRLADDFIGIDHPQYTPEEANIAYVAVTRAQEHLDIVSCSALGPVRQALFPTSMATSEPISGRNPEPVLSVPLPQSTWDAMRQLWGEDFEQIAIRHVTNLLETSIRENSP